MIKVTETWTRPDVNTPFFKVKDSIRQYISNRYTRTNKVLVQRDDDAAGSLSVTLVTIFADEAARTEFTTDAEIVKVKDARAAYNVANNITAADLIVENI